MMITIITFILAVTFYLFQINYKNRLEYKKKKQDETLFLQAKIKDYMMDLKEDDATQSDMLS